MTTYLLTEPVLLTSGWCRRQPDCNSEIGCECIRAPELGTVCVPCACRELGLPDDSDAAAVLAELLRRVG